MVTLPAGQSVDSPGRRSRNCAAVESRLRAVAARHAPGRLREHRTAPPSSPATGARRSSSPTRRPTRTQAFEDNPKAAETRRARRSPARTVAGAPVHLTGFDALSVQSGGGNGPGVLLEALLGGFGALLVLAFVFGSFLAIVPIMMAIVSILTTFLVVWGLTTVTEVSPIVQFLIALIGLGVSIDYALLIVVRWREERAHGLERRRGDRARDGRPPGGRSCSAARPSRSACSRSSRCRFRSCARSATAAC